MTPQDEEIATLRETNQRLNRRCQLAEAAANLKVEDWGKRSQKHGRAYIFQMGVDFGKEQAEAARDHLRARLRELMEKWEAVSRTNRVLADVNWGENPEFAEVVSFAAKAHQQCAADLLAVLTEPEEREIKPQIPNPKP